MDAYLLTNTIVPRLRESFAEQPADKKAGDAAAAPPPAPPKRSWLSFVISTAIGAYAAYLSWQCNTLTETHIVLKVLFAIVAFAFGLLYLLLYLIFRRGDCAFIREKIPPTPKATDAPIGGARRR
jgi:hypothetical protein